MRRWVYLSLGALSLFAAPAMAQLPGLVSQPLAGGGQSWSLPVQTLVFITSLTFLPAAHHHRLRPAAQRAWHPFRPAEPGAAGPCAVFVLFYHVAGA